MRGRRWLGSLVAGVVLVAPGEGGDVWQRLGQGWREPAVLAVAADPAGPRRLYAGTQHRLYGSTDGGERWRALLTLRGSATAIHAVAVTAQQVWAATDGGLWHSPDRGRHWRQVLRGLGEARRQVFAVAVTPPRVWAGTAQGLVVSDDVGRTWRPVAGVDQLAISAIAVVPARASPTGGAGGAAQPDRLLLGTSSGLWRSTDGGTRWDRVLVLTAQDAEETVENGEPVEDDAPRPGAAVTSVACSPSQPTLCYAGAVSGVYHSMDAGATWRAMSRLGLPSVTIHHLIAHPWLVAATSAGLFQYSESAARWEALREGLTTAVVHDVAADARGRLYAATDAGLFRSDAQRPGVAAADPAQRFVHEPSIRELQEVAIRYAEVSPEKIARWRRLAARRAWLPTVSLSYDQDLSISDRVDEGTFPAYQVTDDKDLDRGWDLSVSWNLGDLIWSGDQTSIDVRSRLMVQLRDDILDEINRLYFERRRLQLELALSPPPTQQEQLERDLRLQELTADLDALTGGYFSRRLEP